MRLWETDFTTQTGLRGLFSPDCKHCNILGDFYMAKAMKTIIDIEMKCPECGYWWAYRVPITKKHYDWFNKEFNNVFDG